MREDRITLSGIRISPRIGTTAQERSAPQECTADLTIWGDFESAAATDSLEKSIDYTKVLAVVLKTADEQEYNLIETLAYRTVRKVLHAFPVNRVAILLRKRPEIMRGLVDHVEIEVEESLS